MLVLSALVALSTLGWAYVFDFLLHFFGGGADRYALRPALTHYSGSLLPSAPSTTTHIPTLVSVSEKPFLNVFSVANTADEHQYLHSSLPTPYVDAVHDVSVEHPSSTALHPSLLPAEPRSQSANSAVVQESCMVIVLYSRPSQETYLPITTVIEWAMVVLIACFLTMMPTLVVHWCLYVTRTSDTPSSKLQEQCAVQPLRTDFPSNTGEALEDVTSDGSGKEQESGNVIELARCSDDDHSASIHEEKSRLVSSRTSGLISSVDMTMAQMPSRTQPLSVTPSSVNPIESFVSAFNFTFPPPPMKGALVKLPPVALAHISLGTAGDSRPSDISTLPRNAIVSEREAIGKQSISVSVGETAGANDEIDISVSPMADRSTGTTENMGFASIGSMESIRDLKCSESEMSMVCHQLSNTLHISEGQAVENTAPSHFWEGTLPTAARAEASIQSAGDVSGITSRPQGHTESSSQPVLSCMQAPVMDHAGSAKVVRHEGTATQVMTPSPDWEGTVTHVWDLPVTECTAPRERLLAASIHAPVTTSSSSDPSGGARPLSVHVRASDRSISSSIRATKSAVILTPRSCQQEAGVPSTIYHTEQLAEEPLPLKEGFEAVERTTPCEHHQQAASSLLTEGERSTVLKQANNQLRRCGPGYAEGDRGTGTTARLFSTELVGREEASEISSEQVPSLSSEVALTALSHAQRPTAPASMPIAQGRDETAASQDDGPSSSSQRLQTWTGRRSRIARGEASFGVISRPKRLGLDNAGTKHTRNIAELGG